ncbi:MAG TPA: hydantoinase/oxoprolinase family protein [Methylibium sp.]|uniref:hydantoinase/oxoprolinase family protein n=1 Tax=Methylibium sp. TaxID=2067992 RepID=UPI002DBB5768|nr:hydantoinase/oxoprolinase family protein [Methylibium sp.]HEU4459798.1 hydantoinase/oxoprolinase family protein [Methylibium sp.]
MPRRDEPLVAGWDIGGAHVKLSLVAPRGGSAHECVPIAAEQWPCPLWQGLDRLDAVLAEARALWPELDGARHAVTMTGEMVDLFEHREAGVLVLAEVLSAALGDGLAFWAGEGGWCGAGALRACWPQVASANWAATASLAARRLEGREALLVDIGSTTTDLVALRDGAPCSASRSDADRLASGELLYQGVVRTPLCALAPRIEHRGRALNVMNECFATTADVHRLLGQLDTAHDQQPTADGGPKDLAATRRRLARMIGLDARDAVDDDWHALAACWREAQLGALRENAERVVQAAALAADAPVVAAGCGDFLAFELARRLGRPCMRFDALVLGDAAAPPGAAGDERRRAIQLAAPAVAVALLFASMHPAARDESEAANDADGKPHRRCGS